MVFWYSTVSSTGKRWEIYMGRDKHENEDLIKYGLPCDLWFHVDDLSSAHVYLVCPSGFNMHNVPPEIIDDCCQLVKANSIEGCKKSAVKIVYTPWENLKKTGDMDTGQIGFVNSGERKYARCEKKNEVVNRISKTKAEHPTTSIRDRKDAYEREQRSVEKRAKRAMNEKEKERVTKEVAIKTEEQEFADLFKDETFKQSNKNITVTAEEYENDFM